METERVALPRSAARKSVGRAPLQDLAIPQPAKLKPQPQPAMESVKSSLTPLLDRLRLQDGRGTWPGSGRSTAIKIWADSQPSLKFSPKETLEENDAQLGLVPNTSSMPKTPGGAGSHYCRGKGESASPAVSLPGEELVQQVVMTPLDDSGRWQPDTTVTSRSDGEVEMDNADRLCPSDTLHALEVRTRMGVHCTDTSMAENKSCLDSDPVDSRASQDAVVGSEKQSHTSAGVASVIPSVCSAERPSLCPMHSAGGGDPEEGPVTQTLGSPLPSTEKAGSLKPASSPSALKEMEENRRALPGPEDAGNCPLPSGGEQPSLWLPKESPFPVSVLKDADSSPLQKPSLEEASAVPSPTSSTEPRGSAARTVSWMTPLAWLENTHTTSAVLESLRQSLPLQRDTGTSVTPVSTFSAATWMSPQVLLEKSMNTSGEWPACAKDSTAETDSLLWQCSREHLSMLSRRELEGRLESTLVIIEALSRQLRDWQESQWLVPHLGPGDQRDVLTQTDVTHPKAEKQLYHDLYVESRERLQALQRHRESEQALKQELEQARKEMRSWTVESRSFLDSATASLQNLQEDRRTVSKEQDQMRSLIARHGSLLDKVVAKLQSCLTEQEEARRQAAEALQAKEAAGLVLEAFCVHTSARIRAQDQGLGSQRELCDLAEEAREQQRSWTVASCSFLGSANAVLQNWQENKRVLSQQQDQIRALIAWHRSSLDKVVAKLRSCLAEREEARRQAAEALQAKEVVARELERVTVALQVSAAQVDQLTLTNSRLEADLSILLRDLANLERERDKMREKLSEETTQLTREKELLQQEHAAVRQELREMAECREFIDQENCVYHEQLVETENKLKATVAVLQERSTQLEDLKDVYQRLQTERDTLCGELQCSKAEALGLQLNRNKILTSSLELTQSKERLLDLAADLRAALQGEASDAVWKSRAYTPRSHPMSFVGSVLKAVAEGIDEAAAGGTSTFTEVEPAAAQKPADIEDNLLEVALELKAAVSHLVAVNAQTQEAASREVQGLQAKISDHQHHLESLESQLQAEIDDRDANIAKLNKVLRVKFQTEKELQDVVRKQEEKMMQLIDQSGAVTSLKTEVSQLKRLLQRAETEAEVLWEEVRGQQPGTVPLDAGAIQEKVWLRQEVTKLRELLLGKEHEYQDHRRILEGKLHNAQMMLRSQEEMQEKIKETLSSIPDAVTASSLELQSLLGYLGLKLVDGKRCFGDAL